MEVLVAVMLIALALAPMIDSLTTSVAGARIHGEAAEESFHLASLLEETLAQPFGALDAEALAVGGPSVPTAYSDPGGSTRRRLVYLARYDGDNADSDGNRFTGGDDGLLWIRVALGNSDRDLETLTTR